MAETLSYNSNQKMSRPEGTGNGIGGKAENLAFLRSHGFNVPAWIVISDGVFRAFTHPIDDEIGKILGETDFSDARSMAQKATEIRRLMLSMDFSNDIKGMCLPGLDDFIDPKGFYAVRSSAEGEDSRQHSFAGQMDSILGVKGRENIMHAIRECWASAYSERALAYRHQAGMDQRDVSMAVIVQDMVFGEVSGVTFTTHPVTQSIREMLIHASYGLGEGIVSGGINADHYVMDKGSFACIDARPGDKDRMVAFDETSGKGTTTVPVNGNRRNALCLDDGVLKEITQACRDIETLYQCPQDIEWTLKDKGLYILQARPVTTFSREEFIEQHSLETVWDNSNITESYSGITSPLTFSFVRHAYYMVYLQFCQILRVPEKVISEQDYYLRNILGILNGQVYYNLKNCFRILSNLPGFNYNKQFMEEMMGVKEPVSFDIKEEKTVSAFRKYAVELPRLIKTGMSLILHFAFIDGQVKRFMKRIETSFSRYDHFDFDGVSAQALLDIYLELERDVLMHWKAPIVNDFLVMIFYGVLRRLMVTWDLDEKGSLQNDLLCGQGDVESTRPMELLLSIASEIKRSGALSERFETCSKDQLGAHFLSGGSALTPEEQSVKSRIEDYIDQYGFRCMNELKLESLSLRDDPGFLFVMLKNYLNADLKKETSDETIRIHAENHVRERLKSQVVLRIIPRKWLFDRVLNLTRKGVKFREYQRFARTKMFGLVRSIFKALGKKFHHFKMIDDPGDIFYLTREEVFSLIEGSSVCADCRGIIAARKAEYDTYADDLGQRMLTRGIVYRKPFTTGSTDDKGLGYSEKEDLYKGVSCCPGIVRGTVKVIRDQHGDLTLNGEILVAGKTDPGWVLLYPSASGLLTERGSILSHSAIVAREIGLPAIVGIPGLLDAVQTGDEVEMDAGKGTVRIIKKAASGGPV